MQLKKRENFNILILDDEESIVNFLKATIEDEGFRVFEYTNPKNALDILKNKKIDLILLDYKMPEMDGLSFMKKADEIMGENKIPIIIISAYGKDIDKNLIGKMKNIKVMDIIPKNVSIFEAKKRILKVIEEYKDSE